MKTKIDRNAIVNRAMELVLEQAAADLPGSDKANAAVAKLKAWADEQWEPKTAAGEWASDRVLDIAEVLLRALVELAYQSLRAQGRI